MRDIENFKTIKQMKDFIIQTTTYVVVKYSRVGGMEPLRNVTEERFRKYMNSKKGRGYIKNILSHYKRLSLASYDYSRVCQALDLLELYEVIK